MTCPPSLSRALRPRKTSLALAFSAYRTYDVGKEEVRAAIVRYTTPRLILKMELDCAICRVRSWSRKDADSIARYANNRKIWLNLRDRFPHPYRKADAKNWVESALIARPETNFAIEASGEAVGGIGFELKTDVERYSAEVGYWLGEEFWNRGICTAALKAATAYAFKTYNLNRIFALPFIENRASMRVLEKAGYRQECVVRRSAFKDGRFVDQVVYAYLLEG